MPETTEYPVAIDPIGHAGWEMREEIERCLMFLADLCHFPRRIIAEGMYNDEKQETP